MAESIQPYTASRIDYLAKYLQSLLPGLNYDVAKTWISSEKGVSGNVLGTTYNDASGQHLFKYASQEAGLRAAASWINTRSIYSGVKNSLGLSASTQAYALANSPWNRSYYQNVFKNLISSTGSSNPGGGASTPTVPSPNSLSAWQQALASIGISTDPNHKITQAESDKIATQLYKVDPKLFGSNLVGKTINDIGGNINFDPTTIPGNVADFLGTFDIGAAVMFIGVILVGITLIGTGGLVMLKGKS